MKIKIKHTNWFGFDFKAVKKKFTGGVEWIGQVEDEHGTSWAMFSVENPDRSKGHKDFMLLNSGYVNGKNREDAIKMAETEGLLCFQCLTYVYSSNRHDMAVCLCGHAFVDGGKGPYGRYGGTDVGFLSYNLITKTLKALKYP